VQIGAVRSDLAGASRGHPTPLARVLLIDDEPLILSFVARGLRSHGYDVDTAEDGVDGLRAAIDGRYDLLILDLLMPRLDGMSLLREVLEHPPAPPVIVLSAVGDTASKVECLELGAEDYLAKPFSLDELLARVGARLRHLAEPGPATMRVGRLCLDLIRREADSGSGSVQLSEREFLVLQQLMRNAGRTVSKDRLLSLVWGYYFTSGSNVLDVYVGRLRRKLGARTIRTVRGEGYRIDAD
jgi:DNA-binding response OmpR family regulator